MDDNNETVEDLDEAKAVAVRLTIALERGMFVLAEMMQAYERRIRSDCTSQEQLDKRPWECAEYRAASEYLRLMKPETV